jgi:uncharacterized protein (UPF0276 family)
MMKTDPTCASEVPGTRLIFCELARAALCGLLLDVVNVCLSASNRDLRRATIDAFRRRVEIHLARPTPGPVLEPRRCWWIRAMRRFHKVWALYERLISASARARR